MWVRPSMAATLHATSCRLRGRLMHLSVSAEVRGPVRLIFINGMTEANMSPRAVQPYTDSSKVPAAAQCNQCK